MLPRNPGAWPFISAEAEDKLRVALLELATSPPRVAHDVVLKLEDEHKARRSYVWADLGWTPLALSLEHLAEMARITSSNPPEASVEEMAEWYASTGWHADRAMVAALNEAERKADLAAIEASIAAIYRPWLDTAAMALQAAVGPMANAGTYETNARTRTRSWRGRGLRRWTATRRGAHANRAIPRGRIDRIELETALAALPTVTETSKPALVPMDQRLLGAGEAARRLPCPRWTDRKHRGSPGAHGRITTASTRSDGTRRSDWDGLDRGG